MPDSPPQHSTAPAPQTHNGAAHTMRQLAEWVSFGVSALIVLALAAYLVYDGLRTNGPIVPVDAAVAIDHAVLTDSRYVVPISVRNNGRRAIKDVKVEVTHASPGGEKATQDFDIDYLAETSHETIYLYLDRDPRDAEIESRVLQYRLE